MLEMPYHIYAMVFYLFYYSITSAKEISAYKVLFVLTDLERQTGDKCKHSWSRINRVYKC